MKKILLSILFILICFTLTGCDKLSNIKFFNFKKTTLNETPTLKEIEVNDNACKNLVIFIGDGMGFEHIKSGELVYNKTYDFTTWKHTSSNTFSYNAFAGEFAEITDSAAGGTAIATGEVTINSYVGKDKDGNDLATILDYAKKLGKSTGVITTDTLTGATPADFSAHVIDRSMSEAIIDTQIKSNIDILIGEYNDGIDERSDDIMRNGYTYFPSYEGMLNLSGAKKAYCQFNFVESGGSVTLTQAAEVAIEYLSQNENGYCLMIEAAHIDKRSHNNDFESMVKAIDALNDAIDYVKSISNDETAIIITADHETGGLEVSLDEISTNVYENTYYRFYSTSHTGTNVPLYIYGFDVNFIDFSYFGVEDKVKNSDIFRIALYSITGNKY